MRRKTYESGRDYGFPRQRMRGKQFKIGDRVRFKSDKSLGTVVRALAYSLVVEDDNGDTWNVSTGDVIHSAAVKTGYKNPTKALKPQDAKELFNALMELSHQRELTVNEKKLLTMARQRLRQLKKKNPNDQVIFVFTKDGVRHPVRLPSDWTRQQISLWVRDAFGKNNVINWTAHEPKTKSKTNPTNGTKIYGRCLRIEAIKTVPHTYGGKPSRAGQKYFHDFTTKNAMIYGLPDGSLLIKAK